MLFERGHNYQLYHIVSCIVIIHVRLLNLQLFEIIILCIRSVSESDLNLLFKNCSEQKAGYVHFYSS